MKENKSDKRSDIHAAPDRGENLSLLEPLLISERSPNRSELIDLAFDLATKSAGLRRSLPIAIQESLANIVRAMNCYYSNLIEGHDTHPIEIERALHGDYSTDVKKRNLQKEAKAHIAVQEWIDKGGIKDQAFTENAIVELHRRFCELLPEDLLWVEDPVSKKKEKVIPGAFRSGAVAVGRHIPISGGAIPRFLQRFEEIYSPLRKTEAILAFAAAHHRLLWIHPFLDGNGRVARLMSHAAALQVLDTGGMWSIARGLARNVALYKDLLSNCDMARRNDLDGRGNLSEEAMVEFTRFFLTTCIDQIEFMEKLMQPELLRTRIILWAREESEMGTLPAQAIQILEAVLYRGEISRGEMSSILDLSDRHARRLISPLIEKGVLTSDSPKSPLKLAFPATLASRWLPGLFPV